MREHEPCVCLVSDRGRRDHIRPDELSVLLVAVAQLEPEAAVELDRTPDIRDVRIRRQALDGHHHILTHPAGTLDEMLERLAHFVMRRRWPVIAVWIVLTLFGAFAAAKVSKRWYQSFSIPGKPAYETSQRTLRTFGVGVRPPVVVVFHTGGDATQSGPIKQAMQRASATVPGSLTSSYFSTRSDAYVSSDRHTTFMNIYPPGRANFNSKSNAEDIRDAAAAALPPGTTVAVTGHDPLEEASSHGSSGGPSVLLEALVGGLGALIILLFVFGTAPAVLMPLVVAVSAILNTFTLVWALTYLTDVSIIVEFLIAP